MHMRKLDTQLEDSIRQQLQYKKTKKLEKYMNVNILICANKMPTKITH